MPTIIQTNPKILGGQPVIKGTRVPVARVLALIGMNYTLKDLKKEIPHLDRLTKKNIGDILDYYKHQINV
ncbi:MAG: hypothetical protein US48_C0008G0008 [Candidatus Levybacteria bacterium GW2011_GWA2_37_36]|nr:MAG: hypothetical protein US43_C0015G0006 [Candidatus Levybacteria bacterium GW2011_GWA1_37_16]KKQ33869.1 MAG: hypothetical protein US48_C0008G0008 [Candidatus Levybacteria bacterium GW2011_GWA2_37_36]KKQ42410.1 MAG: hypothetical protein US59_C0009G0006 [Candidatus Levybacteria bacterium GW2011_GWB1_37_8]OGH50076.1 MAG: hypothetical protein A3H17_02515 [Candidatus Levybacteria bacterium RIFCSPLOWO2_12_FULL_37_14]